MFVSGLDRYHMFNSKVLLLNGGFLPRLAFPLALWWGSRRMKGVTGFPLGDLLEVACHVAAGVLLTFELMRWGRHSPVVSRNMANALISAVWALQAAGLVVLGLATRNRMRRILGFALFALTVAKIFFVDTASLEYVYRIVSFVATGLLLLVVGYFYQRYLTVIFGPQPGDEPPASGPREGGTVMRRAIALMLGVAIAASAAAAPFDTKGWSWKRAVETDGAAGSRSSRPTGSL